MDNIIYNYKELLINKSGKNHVYYFQYSNEDEKKSVKGFYSIDEYGAKWMSVDAISAIFSEIYYEKIRSKYFDLNNENQKLFYSLEVVDLMKTDILYGQLIKVIKSNTRHGTPRKFLTDSKGEKVNIEMSFNTIANFKF